MLHNFSKNPPPRYHATKDDISTPSQRLEADKTTGHRSVRGRDGIVAVMKRDALDGTLSAVLGNGKKRPLALLSRIFAPLGRHPEPAPLKQPPVPPASNRRGTAGAFLGVTERVPRHPAMAAYRTPTGFADTAPSCTPTGLTFGATRATTLCGGLGKSARLPWRMEVGHIWFEFFFYNPVHRSSFLFLRRAKRLQRKLYEVLGVYTYTYQRVCTGGPA